MICFALVSDCFSHWPSMKHFYLFILEIKVMNRSCITHVYGRFETISCTGNPCLTIWKDTHLTSITKWFELLLYILSDIQTELCLSNCCVMNDKRQIALRFGLHVYLLYFPLWFLGNSSVITYTLQSGFSVTEQASFVFSPSLFSFAFLGI